MISPNDILLTTGGTGSFTNIIKMKKKLVLTLVIKKGKSGYLIGQLKKLPAVFTQ
jgi:hypothetical protein